MLQPKAIKKHKGKVFKNFTWTDFIFGTILLLISFAIAYFVIPIPKNWKYFKLVQFILTVAIGAIFSTLLTKSKKYNCRVYILFIRMLKFAFRIKKFEKDSKKGNDTNLLIPYKDIIDNSIIQTKSLKSNSTKYFSVIKFKGKSPWTDDSSDKDAFIRKWNDILDSTETHLSIIRTKELMDYDTNFKNLQKDLNKKMKKLEETNADISVRNNYMSYYENRYEDFENLDQHLLFDTYYLVIYSKRVSDLYKNINAIYNTFETLDTEPTLLTDIELLEFLAKMNNSNLDKELANKYLEQRKKTAFANNSNEEFEEKIDIIWKIKSWFLEKFKKHKQQEKEVDDFITLDSLIKNDSVIFKSTYFIKNDKYYSIQIVSDLPINLDENWASVVFDNNSRIVWQLSPIDETTQATMLDKTNKRIIDNVDMTKSRYNKKNDSLQLEALEFLENQLQVNGNLLFNSSLLVINEANDIKELKKIEQKNFYNARKFKINLNPVPFKQFEAYAQSCLITTNNLEEDIQMSSENIAYGWAFENDTNNDGNSFILGETYSTSEPIIFDQFYKKSSRRSNYNMFTVGSSGKGKSTDVKKAIVGHLTQNNKVYVIDVQNEYKTIGQQYGASNIDLGVGYKTVINPLEIQILLNDDEEEYTINLVVNKHMEWLEQYFRLVNPNFNTDHIISIMKCVRDLYEDFGVYKLKNIHDLKKIKIPIMSDLIKKIKNYKYVDDFEKTRKQLMLANIVEQLEFLFEHNGKFQALYNGQTNINLDNDFIIFNTQKLNDDSSGKVGLFVLLSFIQNKVYGNFIADKSINTVIVIDELHVYIDPNNMTALNFVYTMTKTVRKFNAGMILCTQNPSDFLGSTMITSKAQAILENCQYSKFFGLRQKDLEAVIQMYKASGGLNNSQVSFLADSDIGKALFSLHMYSKIRTNIYYNEFEETSYFSKGKIGKEWAGTNE